jgi:Flp pilus assembly protein TadB
MLTFDKPLNKFDAFLASSLVVLVVLTVLTLMLPFVFPPEEEQNTENQMQEIFRLKIDAVTHEMKDEMQKEIEGVRDLIRQHIILSDRKEQLEPLNLNKGKAITDGIGCLIGNVGSCANTINDVL